MSGFHGAFATGVASQQGTLTLPDTWFRPPFWDLLMLQLLRPNYSNLPCLYSTFHLEYPLVLSRFYFFALGWKETVSISVQLHIDDVLSINYPDFQNYLGQMYLAELEIKDTTESLYFLLGSTPVDQEGRSAAHFLYDKRFQLPYHKLEIHSFPHFSPTCFDILS